MMNRQRCPRSVYSFTITDTTYIPIQRKTTGVGAWRRGLASGVTPKYTNMLVYFGVTPDVKPKICVTPDANPRRQSVEYRWRWVFWRWPYIFHVYFMYISCIFHVVCASFSALATQELADANPVSNGIWA